MHRRDFMFGCAASALAVSLPAVPADASPRFYARARLVDPGGRPLKGRALAANRNFIFHYPFAGTPCFLLNLGRPTKPSTQLKTADEQSYQWPGGVGAGHGIHCCSEHSQYDPAEGAKVVAGPAPQPLAAILLEYDAKNDGLYAVGTLGGELFNEFFSKYEFRLALDHGGHARTVVESRCMVSELAQYCRQQVKC